jgi:hypothetical protein
MRDCRDATVATKDCYLSLFPSPALVIRAELGLFRLHIVSLSRYVEIRLTIHESCRDVALSQSICSIVLFYQGERSRKTPEG